MSSFFCSRRPHPARIPLLALLLFGCGSPRGGDADDSSGSETPRVPTSANGLRAEGLKVVPRSLEIGPGDTKELSLTLSPPGIYEVRAALLGESVAAFLDVAETMTHEDGQVTLNVTVAAESAPFSVRLSVGSLLTEIPVTVADRVVANLSVLPKYEGHRAVETWYVTLSTNPDCSNYKSYTEESTRTFAAGKRIELTEVAASTPQTLRIRGENYVFGCKANITLDPSRDNLLEVPVTDRPLQLQSVSMPLALGLDPNAELQTLLNQQIEEMVADFNGGTEDHTEFLERMASGFADPNSLRARSQNEGWAQKLISQLGEDGAKHGLSRVLRSWLFLGSQSLYASDTVVGQLDATKGTSGKATYSLSRIAGVIPKKAGVPETYLATLASDSDDTLRVSLELYFELSRLLGAAAEKMAVQDEEARVSTTPDDGMSGAVRLPQSALELLTKRLDCPSFVSALVRGLTSDDRSPAGECYATCLYNLCVGALQSMWNAAVSSSPGATRLVLSPDANAQIDDEANVVGFEGNWGGQIELPGGPPPQTVRGPFSTKLPPESGPY